ncbi:Adenine phosphoribosyltransferase [Psilocybe cubensis]|uniref:Adenine phosphoribosyltransferase n=2 Tax=Psilocybe cubensis TaxID=181762 RepID=A0ACB8H4U8_PSICU|nr:Adenine phosphoribosyltransferase [Psilocybe cubensis]KAH9482916.1 Adenine phosphoribosyltransferase [Psilocybe cubensis]
MADVELIKKCLTAHPDFPKKGIVFLDIFPILRDPFVFETLITHFIQHITSHTIGLSEKKRVDVIVGLDARGFLFGPIIALRLGAAFVPVRKAGKLPGACISASYEKEYGTDSFEMQAGAITPGQTVVVIDDLIATGGSAKAAGELVAMQGGQTLEYLFVIELMFLQAASKLNAPVYSIVKTDD